MADPVFKELAYQALANNIIGGMETTAANPMTGVVDPYRGTADTANIPMLRRSARLQNVQRPVSISPLQLARGWAAGTAGLPGDIESLGRMLVGADGKTYLPTSEELLGIIPYGATDETGQRAAQVGTMFGGLGVGTGAKAVGKGAKALAPKLGETAEQYMIRTGMALPMDVWHGSPHKFSKFDASKIGTGEGAQAYGHGLYLAENKDVASQYAQANRGRGAAADGLIDALPKPVQVEVYKAMQTPDGWLRDSRIKEIVSKYPEAADVFNAKTANLYKVDLPDEAIARMLDWDKPIKDQGEVLSKVRSLVPEDMLSTFDANVKSGISGVNAYRNYVPSVSYAIREPNATNYVKSNAASFEEALAQVGGDASRVRQLHNYDAAKVAEKLRQAGIPGIKYLDQGSRGASGTGKWRITYEDGKSSLFDFKPNDDVLKQMGATAEPEGTRNFVVFPGMEDILTIKERN